MRLFDDERRNQQNAEQGAAGEPPQRDLVSCRRSDEHAPVECKAGGPLDQASHYKSEGQDQRDPIVRAPEPQHGVRGKGECDQAAGHVEVGTKEGVSQVGGTAQRQQKDVVQRSGHRPGKDDAQPEILPQIPPAIHTYPQETYTCPLLRSATAGPID